MLQTAMKRQYVMLKPMAAGLSGFARLEADASGMLLQLTGKGLRPHAEALRVFLYAGDGAVAELGQVPVNPQGQANLTAEIAQQQWGFSPSRLQAVLVVSGDKKPKPLMIGLCAQQSAGSLLDAKNALLALCEKLGQGEPRLEGPGAPVEALPASTAALPAPATALPAPAEALRAPAKTAAAPALPTRRALSAPLPKDPTPQEVFLSAIDPTVYIPAESHSREPASREPVSREPVSRRPASREPVAQPPRAAQAAPAPDPATASLPTYRRRKNDIPADSLPALSWPTQWKELAQHFESRMPIAPFWAPGWRFVRIPMARAGSFVLGRHWKDGQVNRIAYAVPGVKNQPPPKELARYRWQQGRDGQGYWVLWQEVNTTKGLPRK